MVVVLAVLVIYQYIASHDSNEADKQIQTSLQGKGLLQFSLPPEIAAAKWHNSPSL